MINLSLKLKQQFYYEIKQTTKKTPRTKNREYEKNKNLEVIVGLLYMVLL